MSNFIFPIELGGTGADNRSQALTNLLPIQEGKSGTVLTTNGSNAFWVDVTTLVVNIVQTSGQLTTSVMSQKAVTDRLNLKADLNDLRFDKGVTAFDWGDHSLAGYTSTTAGAGIRHNEDNDTFEVIYGRERNTAVEGDDPRLVHAVPDHRKICAGIGLIGGGDLTHCRTLSVVYGDTACTSVEGNDVRLFKGETAYEWGDHALAGYAMKDDAIYTAGRGLFKISTSFEVKYGSASGTATEGNDPRVNNGQTAFDWGDHSTCNYATESYVTQLINESSLVNVTVGAGLERKNDVITVKFGESAGTVAAGNDPRIANSVTKSSIKQVQGQSTTDIMSQKAVSDSLTAVANSFRHEIPAIEATFTKSSNKIVAPNIVNILNLEVGDVIRFENTTYNNKIFTVEHINNANDIVVNAVHANGVGPLSLTTESASLAKVTRLGKWFTAADSLGFDWVSPGNRLQNQPLTNPLPRAIKLLIVVRIPDEDAKTTSQVAVNGEIVSIYTHIGHSSNSENRAVYTHSVTVPPNGSYQLSNIGNAVIEKWAELR